ncbi:MAG: phosphatase PAP2 family protein [Solirubrobacteraceae bacterium]|nr:phosphatase PAP2 family protein [Solirubrobacteraceae bacterium]
MIDRVRLPAGLLVLVAAGAWIVTSTSFLPGIDADIIAWIAAHRPDWLVDFMRFATHFGQFRWPLTATILAGAFLLGAGAWRLAWRPLASLLIAANLNSWIKEHVGRARPPEDLWASWAPGSGYPSGHSAQAAAAWMALAFALAARWPRHRAALLAGGASVAVLVALSRVVLSVHSPTDVLAGLSVGLAVALLLAPAGALRRRR